MRCLYCCRWAAVFRRTCPTCARVIAVVERMGGRVGLGELVDIFKAQGLTREQVDMVLDAQVGSGPTIRDHLTSQMTNALMRGMGMPGRQSAEDVQRVRVRMSAAKGEGVEMSGEKPRSAT